jgi:tRNA(Ile)-lysidine synthase
MQHKFSRFIQERQLIEPDASLLLTNSGGIDSMVLTHLVAGAKIPFALAHCNFGLRGYESDADEQFVHKTALNYGVAFHVTRFNTKEFAADNKLSIQEAARILRYNWFEKLLPKSGCGLYATAHHFDDQIETFFINLFRGTGISGLRGIAPKNGNCIRPLLFATRAEIEAFARFHRIEYREDSSNSSDDYLRNRIRRHVIPSLDSTKPDFRSGFSQTLDILRGTEVFLFEKIEQLKKEVLFKEGENFRVDLNKLAAQNPIDFVLFEILRHFGFNADTVKALAESAKTTSGKVFLSPSYKIVTGRGEFWIMPLHAENTHFNSADKFINEDASSLETPIPLSFEKLTKNQNFKIDQRPEIAQLDFDKLKFPLLLRKPVEGDYFYPLGMKGKKKLSDFFIDQKFSPVQKQKARVLVSDEKIVWLVGQRIDERFKITPSTKTVFKIRSKSGN